MKLLPTNWTGLVNPLRPRIGGRTRPLGLLRRRPSASRRSREVGQRNIDPSRAAKLPESETGRLVLRVQALNPVVLQQARLEHRRATELLAGKIAAQADFDKTAEALHVAEADLARTQSAIVEAQSLVFTAEKTLLYQKEHLAFTEMRSPYDGLVTRRDRDPGGIVVPGASILQLVATNEIWVSAWVDETAMAGLKTGQPARVVFRSEPAESCEAEVARLGREADRETREFIVDVRVKKLPENWTIGQRAEVFIETGRKSNVVLIPPQVSAVLVTLRDGADQARVAATLGTWPDVTVYSTQQQKDLLLSGMVDKAKRQLGLFRVLLIIISTIIMALIIYTLTLDKIHDVAMLKLMGARNGVIIGLILQQALLIGALGYGLAYWLGTFAFPQFPRLVVIETRDLLSLGAIVLGISVLSSLLGIWKAMSVEPNKVLS